MILLLSVALLGVLLLPGAAAVAERLGTAWALALQLLASALWMVGAAWVLLRRDHRGTTR